jgi:hypothetical protein
MNRPRQPRVLFLGALNCYVAILRDVSFRVVISMLSVTGAGRVEPVAVQFPVSDPERSVASGCSWAAHGRAAPVTALGGVISCEGIPTPAR